MKEKIIEKIDLLEELINESIDKMEDKNAFYYHAKQTAYKEVLKLIEENESNI